MATTYTASASNDVFYYWTTTTSNTTSASNDVWESWHTTDTSYSGTTSSHSVWESWITSNEYTVNVVKPHYYIEKVTSPKLSSETKRARAAQSEINKIWRDLKIQEEEERKALAELTAQDLLMDLIGEKELEYYRETGRLLVKGRKHDYVLKKEGGVYKVEKDKIIDLCIHLKEKYKYPDTDNVIGLLLMIEAEESVFLKTANSHGEVKDEKVRNKVLEIVKRAA